MNDISDPAPQRTTIPLSREEVLGGLGGRSTKQAGALLHLIETRTAQLLADSHQAAAPYNSTPSREVRAQAYLQTLAQGRAHSKQPTIRDLERYARQWAELVPDNVIVRAMTTHLLGERYRIPHQMTPGIRAALGLDGAGVQQAYQQLYQQPLAAIYTDTLSLADGLRWRWARLAGWLENLSPFWNAFALTLIEMVGAGILALPIALAPVGPVVGVVLLLALGLANLLTLAGATEAITRHGPIRYGYAFFGQLLRDLLGGAATAAFSLALLLLNVLAAGALYVGITATLADATGVSAMLWSTLLFLIILYFLRRRSLNATIASALVIGFLNLMLLLILVALAAPHVRLDNLRYVYLPGLNGATFEPQLIELVFGIVLTVYFGHTAVGNVAKVVLHRDPSGRTLLWGNITALLVALVLYSVWVIAINGSIAPSLLANTTGTALGPLAEIAGPAVHLFGSIFVVLGMGMAVIHFSLALFNQVQEWLPTAPSTQWLTGKGARIVWGILPSLMIFLVVQWMLLTNRASFAELLGLIGALIVPLLAGIFPVLLLAASRHKGDYLPGVVWHWLGHPVVLGIVYLFFFGSLLAHGLIIWPDPLRRIVALAVCLCVLVLTWLVLRRGALTPRTVLEVRQEQGRGRFQIVSHGEPLTVPIEIHTITRQEKIEAASGELANLANVRFLLFYLPPASGGELKLWLHQLNAEGTSSGLPARCLLHTTAGTVEHVITTAEPEVLIPWDNTDSLVEVHLVMDKKAKQE
jgi:amino acid permease